MIRLPLTLAVLTGVVVLAGRPALATEPGSIDDGELRRTATAEFERASVRGAGVALFRGGELVWLDTFGVRDERSGDPVTPATVFQAASIGKVVAAYAALMLVEEGRWSLDMAVSSGRLATEPGCEAPTLAQILSHTAGLGNDLMADRYSGECHPPAAFSYAGQGYLVLQDLLEAETGKPAEDFISEKVLAPLGMHASTYAQPTGNDLATGHVDLVYALIARKAPFRELASGVGAILIAALACVWLARQLWRRYPWPTAATLTALEVLIALALLVGAGSQITLPVEPFSRRVLLPASLHASIEDLARFTQELLRPTLVTPATRDLLLAPETEMDGGMSWGPGIGIDRSVQPVTYWQWGSNPGFQGLLVIEPEQGDAAAILTNTGGFLDVASPRSGGYNASKRLARRALGIHGRWDLHRPAP